MRRTKLKSNSVSRQHLKQLDGIPFSRATCVSSAIYPQVKFVTVTTKFRGSNIRSKLAKQEAVLLPPLVRAELYRSIRKGLLTDPNLALKLSKTLIGIRSDFDSVQRGTTTSGPLVFPRIQVVEKIIIHEPIVEKQQVIQPKDFTQEELNYLTKTGVIDSGLSREIILGKIQELIIAFRGTKLAPSKKTTEVILEHKLRSYRSIYSLLNGFLYIEPLIKMLTDIKLICPTGS